MYDNEVARSKEAAMDFSLSPEIEDYRRRVRAFVEANILPLEDDPASYDAHENIADVPLEHMRAKAKEAGLWSLAMPKERGGQGCRSSAWRPAMKR
jgi:acyl-CoA dehydrogenase